MTAEVTDPELDEAGELPADDDPGGGRTRGRRAAVYVAVGAAALAVTGGVLLASPLLAVETIVVTGGDQAVQEQVQAAAGVPPGSAMITLDTSAVVERVNQLDVVASARVSRNWPHTVTIDVVPDGPVGMTQEGDQWVLWGAADGRLATSGEPFADAPQLVGVAPDRRPEALRVLAALPADVRGRVTELRWDDRRGYMMTLRDGAGTIRWGDAADAQVKATVISALLLAAPDARWFDVSAPRAPRSAVAEPGPNPVTAPDAETEPGAEGADPVSPPAEPGAAEEQTTGGEQPRGLQPTQ